MTAAVSSPLMVGRDSDLLTLSDAWARAQEAGPRGVVIRGEAGIGKSRLVSEFLGSVGQDAAVAVGQCLDTSGSVGVPYASVKGIVRDLEATFGAEALLEAAGPHASVLTALVPRLAPRDGSATDETSEATGEQLHEAITDLLAGLSARRPIVVVVEDLHWADQATLALLRAVLRMLRRSRVLVLLTYRPEDVGRGHPLRALGVQLDRNAAIDRVELTALDPETVGEQARLIAGRPLSPEEVALIVRRSDGVPFFVEEFVGMSGPGAGLPSTLRELVMARYERLSPGTQRMLRCLAIGGATVEHRLLEQVLADPAGTLDSAAAEAVDAGVLVAGAFDYTFRHALLREGILDVLLPGERSRWHSRYAEALGERPDAESHRVRIADHWLAAHDLPRAFEATVAAMASSSALAPTSAAMLGEQAIELWSQVPEAERVAGMRLDELLHRTASEHRAADDTHRASLLLGRALEEVPGEDLPTRAGYLQEKAVLDYERGLDPCPMLAEALSLLAQCAQTPEVLTERAHAMATLAYVDGQLGHPERARMMALEAVDVARVADNPAAEARAASFAAYLQAISGDVDAGLAVLDAVASEHPDDPLVQWRCYYQRSAVLIGMGRYAEAATEAAQAVRSADSDRTHGPSSGSGAVVVQLAATTYLGRWDEAEALLRDLAGRPPSSDTTTSTCAVRLRLHLCRGEFDAARDLASTEARDVVAASAGSLFAQDLLSALVDVALVDDDLDLAWATMQPAWGREMLINESSEICTCTARLIGALRRRGTPPDQGVEATLRARAEELIRGPLHDRWLALVDAELSGPRGDGSDVVAWQVAADAVALGGVRAHLVPYARYRLAEAQFAAGERAAGTESLATACAVADEVGSALALRWCEELAAQVGVHVPAGGPDGRMPELTERESQVLRLVGQGLTNREIGEELFISAKTASVHVSAILRKLGAASRTEAAVLAARLETHP